MPGGTIRERRDRRTSVAGREGGKHTEKGNTLEHCFPPMVERQKSCWKKAGETQMAQQKGTAKSPLPREEAEHLEEGRLMTRCTQGTVAGRLRHGTVLFLRGVPGPGQAGPGNKQNLLCLCVVGVQFSSLKLKTHHQSPPRPTMAPARRLRLRLTPRQDS